MIVGIEEWTPPEDNLRLGIEEGGHKWTRHAAKEKSKANC